MDVPNPNTKHITILRKYFGHSQFRPPQWKIIYSLMEKKKDQCVIMATGYGKSLCYQYPAVYCNGISIVISPLISLMQDQVLSLQMSNIPACFLGSAQSNNSRIIDDILLGSYRIVYVTPEWCTSDRGIEVLEKINNRINLTLVAIDEAHCVSQWGFDFRSSYRKLGIIRKIFNEVPILAVTATATPQVRTDICKSLNLRNPSIICTSFDRPNLYFSVSVKTSDLFRDLQKFMIKSGHFSYKFPGPTIIYCPTKKLTEKLEEQLKENGIMCASYHADINLRRRTEVHKQFVTDELSVVIATVAFGMGIDKPDVRCVIHYGAPKDMESYYQEVGRAGRDGLQSTCHVFYSSSDFSFNKHFLSATSIKLREYKEQMIRRMQQYMETRYCRRHILLSHFDESNDSGPKTSKPNCCDNCTKWINLGTTDRPQLNIVKDIKLLLKTMDIFNGRFGMTIPIKFLRGMKDPKIPSDLKSHELFGAGKENSEAAWKAIGKLCLREELLSEKSCNTFQGHHLSRTRFPMSTVNITNTGRKFINLGENCPGVNLELSREVEMLFKNRIKSSVETTDDKSNYWVDKLQKFKNNGLLQKEKEQQAFLYNALLRLRDRLVVVQQCNPHMIASDKTLFNLTVIKPSNKSQLADIDGFNEAQIEKFGDSFLKEIAEFGDNRNQNTSVSNTNANNIQLDTKCVLADMLSSEYFNNVVDYESTDMVCKEYEFNDSNSTELNDLEEIVDNIENNIKNEDMWGDVDDTLFENIPLEKITDTTQSLNQLQDNELEKKKDLNETNSFDRYGNAKNISEIECTKNIIIKPHNYDDGSDDNDNNVSKINENTESVPKNVQKNLKKRVLPSWLAQPKKEEIKRRIKSNSLFKL